MPTEVEIAWEALPDEAVELFRTCDVNVNVTEKQVRFWGTAVDGLPHASLVAAYAIDLKSSGAPIVTLKMTAPLKASVFKSLRSAAVLRYVAAEWLEVCPVYPSLWDHLDE